MEGRPPEERTLLSFSRELRRIDDYEGLIELVRREVDSRFGLTNAWLYVFEREKDDHAVLVAAAGPKANAIWKELPIAPIAGDWLIEALRRDEGPIVIADAKLDGNNPEVARRLENRTVVNMPMGVVDHALGVLGCGTFGSDGTVEIGPDVLSYLIQMANISSVALARLVLRTRDAARAKLQTQLAQRQRLESLGLLAGGVAHDFNNLLTVIRAGVNFVKEGPVTARQAEDLALIADAERSATELTRKLLALGRQDLPSLQNADINTVVSDFVRLLERVIPAHIRIEVMAREGLPELQIDPRQLEQVLMNLALNARDAMPRGGRLTIETDQIEVSDEYRRVHPWAKAGQYILLTVRDTGIGMTAEVVERIFEPFFTTKPQGEGTGLGLAVTWGIIQDHGGLIHCYSEVGIGTSFKIYLPAATQTGTRISRVPVGAVPRGSERILVADDQPHVLAVLQRVLSGAGYSVTGVPNGAAAIDAASKAEFDLHVLDAVMPGLSGRETCQRIRAIRPAARFLFTSGYGGNALPASFLSDLGIEVISKPFDPEALLRMVRGVLDQKSR